MLSIATTGAETVCGHRAAAAAGGVLGLEEFEVQLTEAVRASFEGRAAAYAEEVRRLTAARLDPAWSFPTLFLVKDSLAGVCAWVCVVGWINP